MVGADKLWYIRLARWIKLINALNSGGAIVDHVLWNWFAPVMNHRCHHRCYKVGIAEDLRDLLFDNSFFFFFKCGSVTCLGSLSERGPKWDLRPGCLLLSCQRQLESRWKPGISHLTQGQGLGNTRGGSMKDCLFKASWALSQSLIISSNFFFVYLPKR
jgi:hypothetical protein